MDYSKKPKVQDFQPGNSNYYNQIKILILIILIENIGAPLTIADLQKKVGIEGYTVNRKTVISFLKALWSVFQLYNKNKNTALTLKEIKQKTGDSIASAFCLVYDSTTGNTQNLPSVGVG